MNSIDDNMCIQEISFSHDFDPISIKCELDIPDDLLLPTTSIENKIPDNPILDLNADDMMTELEEIKIKVEPSLFGDESCGEFWPVDVELSSDVTELEQRTETMEVEPQEDEISHCIKSTSKEDSATTESNDKEISTFSEVWEIVTSTKQMDEVDQTPSCSNEMSIAPKSPANSVSATTSNCPMKLRRKKPSPPTITPNSACKSSRKIKKPRKHKLQPRYIESSESEKEEDDECYTCQYCAMQFRMKTNYELHLKPNTGSGTLNLPCLYCSINFKDINILEEHIKNKHKACKLCDITFLNDQEYDNHEKLHKSGLIIFHICTCGIEFRDKQLFLNHVFTIHKNKNNFKHPLTRIIKEISYEKMVCKKSILCPYCHINFSDENILLNHKKMRHNVRQCNTCHIHYIDKSLPGNNSGYDPEANDFVCEICQSKQLTKECPVQNKSESCDISPSPQKSDTEHDFPSSSSTDTESENELEKSSQYKVITDSNILQQINNSNGCYTSNIINFKCNFCYRKFSGKNELKDHLKLPDVDNLKLPCLHCNKICINAKKLEKHLKNIHYACKVCDIVFNNKKEIKLHQNDHKLGLIIFFICICGDEFKDFLTFHTHVKFIHKNDKNYINPTKNSIIECTYEYAACISKKICPYCNKTFSTDLDLDNHKKEVHNVYKCEKCDEHYIDLVKDGQVSAISQCRKCILAGSEEDESSMESSSDDWMDKISNNDSDDL